MQYNTHMRLVARRHTCLLVGRLIFGCFRYLVLGGGGCGREESFIRESCVRVPGVNVSAASSHIGRPKRMRCPSMRTPTQTTMVTSELDLGTLLNVQTKAWHV